MSIERGCPYLYIVLHQTVDGSYPRRTYSLGNTTKWTPFWLAQPFLNTWSGQWANLQLYHGSKRCDKQLFSSIFIITWLIINVAVVVCQKPGRKPASSLTYTNIPQNQSGQTAVFVKVANLGKTLPLLERWNTACLSNSATLLHIPLRRLYFTSLKNGSYAYMNKISFTKISPWG